LGGSKTEKGFAFHKVIDWRDKECRLWVWVVVHLFLLYFFCCRLTQWCHFYAL